MWESRHNFRYVFGWLSRPSPCATALGPTSEHLLARNELLTTSKKRTNRHWRQLPIAAHPRWEISTPSRVHDRPEQQGRRHEPSACRMVGRVGVGVSACPRLGPII